MQVDETYRWSSDDVTPVSGPQIQYVTGKISRKSRPLKSLHDGRRGSSIQTPSIERVIVLICWPESCLASSSSRSLLDAKMTLKEDVVRLIDEESSAHVAFLSSLIRIPSPNPPGDTREAIRFIESYLAERGISCELIAPKENAPNLLSAIRGGSDPGSSPRRRLVLNGHVDHFPFSPDEKWQRDPYSGDVADGYVHGLGGVDMKAGLAVSILAFVYLNRFKSRISGDCTLEVVSDEETGGRFGTRYLIETDERKEQWAGDCVLNAEPSGLDSIRFAEKGTLRMTFEGMCKGRCSRYRCVRRRLSLIHPQCVGPVGMVRTFIAAKERSGPQTRSSKDLLR